MIPIAFTLGFVVVAILVYKSFAPFSSIKSWPDFIAYMLLWAEFFLFKLPVRVMVIYGIAMVVCIIIWHFIQNDRDASEVASRSWNNSVNDGLNAVFGSGNGLLTGFVKNKARGVLRANKSECDWVVVGKAVNVIYFLAVLIFTIVIAVNRKS